MSSKPTMGQQDPTASWNDFLKKYSQGDFPIAEVPPIPEPSLLACEQKPKDQSIFDFQSETPYSDTSSEADSDDWQPDAGTSARLQAFYKKYHFLPPPPFARRDDQMRVIAEYQLDGKDQRIALDRCTSLLSAIFEGKTAFVSIFKQGRQIIVSAQGRRADEVLSLKMGNECALCSHTVLRQERVRFEIDDITKDWRFANNPWISHGWIRSYVAQPIFLDTTRVNDKLESNTHKTSNRSESLVVGVLAVVEDQPLAPLNEFQIKLLHEVAEMASREIQANFDSIQRRREDNMRNAISTFLNDTLVLSSITRFGSTEELSDHPQVSMTSLPMKKSATLGGRTEKMLADDCLRTLSNILDADGALILDITEIKIWDEDDLPDGRRASYASAAPANSRISLVSHLETPKLKINSDILCNQAIPRVRNFLQQYGRDGNTRFCLAQGIKSGFEDCFSPHTTAHVAYPLFTNAKPHLLIIVATETRTFSYSRSDSIFTSSIGCILLACFNRFKLEKSDMHKTSFVSSVSHELRTPLHSLLSHIELIRGLIRSNNLEDIESLLDTAEHSGMALRDILENVLESSKMMQADPHQDQKTDVAHLVQGNLAELLTQTARMCATRNDLAAAVETDGDASARDVIVAVEIEDRPLSQFSAITEVAALRRILVNLITNALKYTPAGSVTCRLRLLPKPKGRDKHEIEFSVEDTGVGMEEEFLGGLFAPFVQVNSFSSGAGLGMYIAQSIVHRLKGDNIQVKSTLGKGTTFTVVLPMQLTDPPDPWEPATGMTKSMIRDASGIVALKKHTTSPDQSPKPKQSASGNRNARVLIVDDNPIGRKILVAMVKHHPVDYWQAVDGQDALEQFSDVHPDVVWTDVSMPRMNGVDFGRAARQVEAEKQWKPCRIIAITGLGSADATMKETALAHGFVDQWLVKGKVKLKQLMDDLEENVIPQL